MYRKSAYKVFSSSILIVLLFHPAWQLEEAANGILTINIPGLQANRDTVGYPDGGLRNHMPLLFDPGFNKKEFSKPDTKFKYPTLNNVQRPKSDEDLAFMSVCYCNSGTKRFLKH